LSLFFRDGWREEFYFVILEDLLYILLFLNFRKSIL
jgi:hypothetical protein